MATDPLEVEDKCALDSKQYWAHFGVSPLLSVWPRWRRWKLLIELIRPDRIDPVREVGSTTSETIETK